MATSSHHDAHPPADAPERSNPAAWTIGLIAAMAVLFGYFAFNYQQGAAHGHHLGLIPVAAKEGPGEPDHVALAAARGSDVLDHGKLLFAKNCQSCHGPDGKTNPSNMNPPPRNFHADAFKNPNGAGPYGLYTVLNNGFNGRMPAFPSLSAADRYALVHYVREILVKPNNAANYCEIDSKDVIAKIPAKGTGGGGPVLKPAKRPVPATSPALLAGVAADTAPRAAQARAWVARARDGAEGRIGDALQVLATRSHDASLTRMAQAVAAGDQAAFDRLVLSPAPGSAIPEIVLLPREELNQLYAQLRKAGPATAAGVQ